MSSGSSVPYRLRPNKAVDRELFLALLARLAATMKIENHQYVGLGGPFLEDFRLIHARLGIKDMVCIESEENIHKRQLFNRPVDCIQCVHETLENFIDSTAFRKPAIIWLDYTDPSAITGQIEQFSRSISQVPINSVLRITVNAQPSSLGKPPDDEIAVIAGNMNSRLGNKKTIQEWRLERFKEKMGNLFPSKLTADDITTKNFGRSILKALHLAVEKEILYLSDRKIVWALSTHYADGQAMATATLIITDATDTLVEKAIEGWQFQSNPTSPLLLNMPALSTLERLTMESHSDAREILGFDLPKSEMGEDPFDSFMKFYRVFPHFSRVEL